MSLYESFQKKVTLIPTASVELARVCAMFNEMARKLSVRNSQIKLEHEKKHLSQAQDISKRKTLREREGKSGTISVCK